MNDRRPTLVLAALLAFAASATSAQDAGTGDPSPSGRQPEPPASAAPAPLEGEAAERAGPVLPLEEAISVALEKNFAVRRARHGLAASQSLLRQAENEFDFKLTTTFSDDVRLSRNIDIDPLPGGVLVRDVLTDLEGLSLSLDRKVRFGGTFRVTSTLDRVRTRFAEPDPFHASTHAVSFTYPLWGGRGKDVATFSEHAAQLSFLQVSRDLAEDEMRLAVDVTDAYFEVARSEQFILINERAATDAEERFRVARLRLEEGLITPIDLARSERDLRVRQEGIIAAEESHANARDNLMFTLGQPLETPFTVEADATFRGVEIDLGEAVAEALSSRVDLRRGREALELAELAAKVARSFTRPKLDLTFAAGFVGVGGEEPGKLLDVSNQDTWQGGVLLSHTFGERADDESLVRALIGAEQERLELAELELRVVGDVRSAVRNVAALERRIAVLKDNVELARRSLELAMLQFKEDLISTTDLLTDQTELVESEIQYVDALYDHAVARASLDLVLGRYFTAGDSARSEFLQDEPPVVTDVVPVTQSAVLPEPAGDAAPVVP